MEGREEVLPEGLSAGITGGGDCRRDRRRRANNSRHHCPFSKVFPVRAILSFDQTHILKISIANCNHVIIETRLPP